MRVNLNYIIISLLCAFSAGIIYANPLAELKTLLAQINTYQADFTQTVTYKQANKPKQTFSGKLKLKKPKLFYWQVLSPDPSVLVSDGKELWHYDEDLEQVTIQPLSEEQKNAPIYFLTGEVKDLEQKFKITSKTPGQFTLTPKEEESSFEWLKLSFNPKNQLEKLVVLDQFGQKSVFDFKRIVLNRPIRASIFKFTPPPGVDIIRS